MECSSLITSAASETVGMTLEQEINWSPPGISAKMDILRKHFE